jgi:purine-binding chemotaxis protein CheW
MEIHMQTQQQCEQRFASFVLDSEQPLEMAIDACKVLEATSIPGSILPMPGSAACIDGFIQLRDDTIPVVNMKKRLALSPNTYGGDAKVAVVQLRGFRCGLLFDDIRDVLQIEADQLKPLHPALYSEDRLISNLIKIGGEGRILEVIDLDLIFPPELFDGDHLGAATLAAAPATERIRSYSRFVVFRCGEQQYGVRVEQAQEITFLSNIDDMFQKEAIEGALNLRGSTIPVLSAARLLQQNEAAIQAGEDTRILVLTSADLQYGLIVDAVEEIISIADEALLPLPADGHPAVEGIVQSEGNDDIMVVNVEDLIQVQHDDLQSMARLKENEAQACLDTQMHGTRHLITADCYLIFSLEKHYAIELNDVQEIIEAKDLMCLPNASELAQKVLNLRGTVIPVVNLSAYFNEGDDGVDHKLIIGRKAGRMVALQVNRIVTIYKQVKYQRTPSLHPRYQHCADILDRLIEFVGDAGIKEHVLVINIEKMMRYHLGMLPNETLPGEMQTDEVIPPDEISTTPR